MWHNVFLTNPVQSEAQYFDDEYITPVMSVLVGDTDTALIATGGTDWIIAGYPGVVGFEDKLASHLRVGDMVRVGQAGQTAYTDYMTVLETKPITHLQNGTGHVFSLGGDVLQKDGTYDYATKNQGNPLTAIRVNHSIDLTEIPELNGEAWPCYKFPLTWTSTLTAASGGTPENPGFANRHEAVVYHNAEEYQFFSLYRHRKWTSATQPTKSVLVMQMPAQIRRVTKLRLLGYSMHHKQASGTQAQHEYKEDDWFALRIREIPGEVLSNNMHANGSLHVLHAGSAGDKPDDRGSVHLYSYKPEGLMEVSFAPRGLPSITVELVDREGREAHFGRMHIWLQVYVESCD